MIRLLGVLPAAGLVLSGCANLNMLTWSTDLPGPARAVHLDAPQRVIYSKMQKKNNSSDKLNLVCAEPSPDALQAYAASLGASFSRPDQTALQIANSLAASAGSIGLRTQSITLMRDQLYRICEMYYNGAIDEFGALQLMQRSHDLTLGILAIEQLTGAVVASQLGISTGANADAANNVNNTKAALDRANKDESEKKTALEAATKARDELKVQVEASEKEEAKLAGDAKPILDDLAADEKSLANEKTKLSSLIGPRDKAIRDENIQRQKISALEGQLKKAESTTPPDTATIADIKSKLQTEQDKIRALEQARATAIQNWNDQKAVVEGFQIRITAASETPSMVALSGVRERLGGQRDALAAAEKAVSLASADHKVASDSRKAIEANLGTAIANAKTTASGTVAVVSNASRNNISADTVDIIAKSAVAIVRSIVDKGHLVDSCTAFYNQYMKTQEARAGADQAESRLFEEVAKKNKFDVMQLFNKTKMDTKSDEKASDVDLVMQECGKVIATAVQKFRDGTSTTLQTGSHK